MTPYIIVLQRDWPILLALIGGVTVLIGIIIVRELIDYTRAVAVASREEEADDED